MNSINAARERLLSNSTLNDTTGKNTYTKADTNGKALKKTDTEISRSSNVESVNIESVKPAKALYCIEELEPAVEAGGQSSGALETPIVSQFQQNNKKTKPSEKVEPKKHSPEPDPPQKEVQKVPVENTVVADTVVVKQECMKASVCPKSHKFSKCMELSTDDSLCNIVEISRDKKKAKLGRPGRYSSASQAIEEQSKNIAPRSVIVGSSISSSSILVRILPAQSSLSIVATIKIIEFLLLIYLGTKVPLSMAWRIVVMFYFLALLHFHLKQATSSKKRSESDAVFEHFGIRELERIEMVSQDTVLVFHDGGKNTEFQVSLKKIKECKGVPHACIEYECCNFNKEYD